MLRKNYLDQRNFFKRQLLRTFVMLLLLSIFMGYLSYDYFMDHPDKAKTRIHSMHKEFEKFGLTADHNFKALIEIFWSNLIFCLRSIVAGFIPFLFLSVLSILAFCMPIGVILAAAKLYSYVDRFSLLASLLPHGIFELMAVLYASSAGVYLTIQVSKMILPKFRSNALPFKTLCKQAAYSFILVVVPLLIVAAFIEVYITPEPVWHLDKVAMINGILLSSS